MSVLRAFITLGRLSVLPTIWSDCLAGWWLGGAGNERLLPLVLVGATCLYVGGAFLNDAFDSVFDRQHRRTRPVPAGAVDLGTVWTYGLIWLVSGVAICFTTSLLTGFLGLVLAYWIIFFNAVHRTLTFAPLVLGVSRLLLYLVAASVAADGISGWAIWCGIAQALYVGGIGFPLRRENPAHPVRRWPIVLMAAPMMLATVLNTGEYRAPGLLLCAVLALWILHCVRHSLWSAEPRPEVTSSGLVAGVVLVDWLAVADGPRELSLIFIGLFMVGWGVQSFERRRAR
jgi:4-hydroxybenzoate polyprenyltransferase